MGLAGRICSLSADGTDFGFQEPLEQAGAFCIPCKCPLQERKLEGAGRGKAPHHRSVFSFEIVNYIKKGIETRIDKDFAYLLPGETH